MAHVFVHILTWNDRRYLPDLFESIENQTNKNFTVRVLDNGSTDGTVQYIQQYYPRTLVGRNVKNMGFAGGHNQLFQFTFDRLKDENPDDVYIMVANSDMIWREDVVQNLVKALDANPELAAVQPKLYRAFAENAGDEVLEEAMKSDIVDTTGMAVKKGWRMCDRGAGELDQGQFDQKTDIFGVTGTMSLFRLSALKSCLTDGEVFDGSFFAYREDCDLVWRLARAGWKSAFVPSAVAWHYRGMYGAEKQSLWKRIMNRRGQRPFFAALSTRNQLLLLVKNLSFGDAFRSAPWLIFGEGGRVFYGFVFEKETRKRLFEIPGMLKSMFKKRREILKNAKSADSQLRSYVR